MNTATGLQIAFLVFAFNFFSTLLAGAAARAMALPSASLNMAGQVITFSVATALFLVVRPLRRFAATELHRPLNCAAAHEIAFAAVAKVVFTAGVIGFAAAAALASASTEPVRYGAFPADPARAWEWNLSPAGLAQMVLLSWIVGPVIEELVFRGLLYRAWERQWGWLPSLVLTSACFALCHPSHMAAAFLGSVIYVCVLRRTGTLVASIAVHALFNILISWPMLGQLIMQAPKGDPARWSTWSPFLACLAFTAVALPAYLLMSRRDARDPAAS
jgi:membrane protease YdiL (CAAX protease family)